MLSYEQIYIRDDRLTIYTYGTEFWCFDFEFCYLIVNGANRRKKKYKKKNLILQKKKKVKKPNICSHKHMSISANQNRNNL